MLLTSQYLYRVSLLILSISCILIYSHFTALADVSYQYGTVRPGKDRCTVSKELLNSDDVCLIVRGRRVPLKKEAVDIFLNNPEKYFASLQPKSALFTEDMREKQVLSSLWFWLGIYVIIGLVSAAITAHKAVERGIRPSTWFFVGLLLSVLGIIIVTLLTKPSENLGNIPKGLAKVPLTSAPSVCAGCGYENHPSAKTCLMCKNPLQPNTISDIEKLKSTGV